MTAIPLSQNSPFAEGRRRSLERWFSRDMKQLGSDPTTSLLGAFDNIVTAELSAGPQFSEDEAFGLLALHQGCVSAPLEVGTFLAQDMQDDPETYEPTEAMLAKLSALTVTQDWAIRMLLAVHEERRQSAPALTLKELGFPIE